MFEVFSIVFFTFGKQQFVLRTPLKVWRVLRAGCVQHEEVPKNKLRHNIWRMWLMAQERG